MKPRPARARRLYLMVGHRTIGLSLSTGRGATAAAFARRAKRRVTFFPGCFHRVVRTTPSKRRYLPCSCHNPTVQDRLTWSKCVRTRRCQSLRKSVVFNQPPFPSRCCSSRCLSSKSGVLTVVGDLLVVLDRLQSGWLANRVQFSSISHSIETACGYRARVLTIVPVVRSKAGCRCRWSSQCKSASSQTIENSRSQPAAKFWRA